MDNDFSKALQGFDKVWQRVQRAKPHSNSNRSEAAKKPPVPPKNKNNSRARRFEP